MAPQHIDDLPRHEEPRQLMLGLIDHLPDRERRGARQLMMCGGYASQSQWCCLSFWSGSRRRARNH
jgi:hypothetical protein